MSDISQPLAPGLYLVSTPIGNLEDITLRALRVLRDCDRIACEDTRQTQKLLNHFSIQKPTISYHEHNEAERTQELLQFLASGERIALVSDAGTPGISDPGHRVVRAAVAGGVPVIPVPGAVAFAAALVASGLPTEEFRFVGFLPAQSGARRTALESLREEPATLVIYEAPHRILDALKDVVATLGEGRHVVIARELTKLHEEFLRGAASSVLKELTVRERVRGEIVLLIAGKGAAGQQRENTRDTQQTGAVNLGERMHEAMLRGLDEREALKVVARESGISKSELYREWQRTKETRRPHKRI